jgi:hypothetical protein
LNARSTAHIDRQRALRAVLETAGTAVAYALVGALALLLAIPTGFASPLYPSAGIALACVLVFGYHVAIGVFIGAWVVNLSYMSADAGVAIRLGVPAIIAFGAALQAIAAAWFVSRFVRRPIT